MFRCKVKAFRVLDFYIGLLEHFKKCPWEDFNKKLKFGVILFLLIYCFKLYQTFFLGIK